MAGTTLYLPSIAAHTISNDDIVLPKIVGSTWLYEYKSDLWPVVLCDDKTPPEPFLWTRPSGNTLPAVLLGKAIYIWVVPDRLRQIDLIKNYLEDESTYETCNILECDTLEDRLEKARYNAFKYHVSPPRSPAFWKNYIEQRSVARRIEREITAKREYSASVSYHGSRRRHDSIISIDSRNASVGGGSGPRPPRSQRAKNVRAIKDNPPGNHLCTIFVGEAMTPFFIPLDRSAFLRDRVIYTEDLRYHADLSKEFGDVEADDFVTVAEYLRSRRLHSFIRRTGPRNNRHLHRQNLQDSRKASNRTSTASVQR